VTKEPWQTVAEMRELLAADMFDPRCPSREMPARLGNKWMPLVLFCLEEGPRRFSELRLPLRGITPKVLAETLRAMERDGLVDRRSFDEAPPRVEYELTHLGRSLMGPLEVVGEWCDEHADEVRSARAAWEQSADEPRLSGELTEG
jgi:DNA-binding HxlR family transcriptional regulator